MIAPRGLAVCPWGFYLNGWIAAFNCSKLLMRSSFATLPPARMCSYPSVDPQMWRA